MHAGSTMLYLNGSSDAIVPALWVSSTGGVSGVHNTYATLTVFLMALDFENYDSDIHWGNDIDPY